MAHPHDIETLDVLYRSLRKRVKRKIRFPHCYRQDHFQHHLRVDRQTYIVHVPIANMD